MSNTSTVYKHINLTYVQHTCKENKSFNLSYKPRVYINSDSCKGPAATDPKIILPNILRTVEKDFLKRQHTPMQWVYLFPFVAEHPNSSQVVKRCVKGGEKATRRRKQRIALALKVKLRIKLLRANAQLCSCLYNSDLCGWDLICGA